MPLKFGSVSDVDRKFRTLLYGESGSGKTTAALSARFSPEMCPILVIDIDEGMKSVTGLDPEIIRPIYIEDTRDLNDLMNEFKKPEQQRHASLRGVRTVIIDSVTAMRDRLLDISTEASYKKAQAAGGNYASKYSRFRPQIQNYGEATYSISTILDILRQAGMNIIVIAALDEAYKDVNNTPVLSEVRPLINDKLRQRVYLMMDNVWFLEEHGGRYTVQVLPRDTIVKIKTRNDVFGKELRRVTREDAPDGKADVFEGRLVIPSPEVPTLPYLYDIYREAIDKEKENG